MSLTLKNWNIRKLILLGIDILLLIGNAILFFSLYYISHKEYYYRGSLKLYFPQLLLLILAILIDVAMNIKNISNSYSGHNKYGMIMRFFIFYLIIASIMITHQNSYNINHYDIKSASKFVLIFGSVIDGIVVISMIVSFTVIDEIKEKKVLVKKSKKNENNNNVYSTEKSNLIEDNDDPNKNIFNDLTIEMK